jgi:uncharacterized protein (DUF433 family)
MSARVDEASAVVPANGRDDEMDLISRWIMQNPRQPSEMIVRDHGTSVWALVGYARGVDNDIDDVAQAYALPAEAVRAALAYYRRHPLQIDAKLEANAAWHNR